MLANNKFSPYSASESWVGRWAYSDWYIIGILLALCLFGTLMMVSVGGYELALNHFLKVILGFMVLFFIISRPLEQIYWVAYWVYFAGLFLLLLVDIMGVIGLGAKRWLNIGGFRFQPSEIMKIALILALAKWYAYITPMEVKRARALLVPVLMIMAPAILVMVQPDLGTAMLIILTGAVIMFLAGVPVMFFGMAGFMGVLISVPAWLYFLKDYQKKRVLTFLNPEHDPSGSGYHILQSLISIGSGGMFGKGFGKGSQSYNEFLPEKHTDFVFAVINEEFGFMGAIFILGLQAFLIIYVLLFVAKMESVYGRLVSGGVIGFYALHVIINSGMVMGVLPVVGVPLPMLSFGGTIMISILLGFGLIITSKIDRNVRIDKNLQYDGG